MTNWKQVQANSNLIQTSTAKAVLIKLPKSDFMFWHPAKLVKTYGKSGYILEINYTNEFTFKCFKNGSGYNSTKKVAEMELNVAEFEAYFGVKEEKKEEEEVEEVEIAEEKKEEVIETVEQKKEIKIVNAVFTKNTFHKMEITQQMIDKFLEIKDLAIASKNKFGYVDNETNKIIAEKVGVGVRIAKRITNNFFAGNYNVEKEIAEIEVSEISKNDYEIDDEKLNAFFDASSIENEELKGKVVNMVKLYNINSLNVDDKIYSDAISICLVVDKTNNVCYFKFETSNGCVVVN